MQCNAYQKQMYYPMTRLQTLDPLGTPLIQLTCPSSKLREISCSLQPALSSISRELKRNARTTPTTGLRTRPSTEGRWLSHTICASARHWAAENSIILIAPVPRRTLWRYITRLSRDGHSSQKVPSLLRRIQPDHPTVQFSREPTYKAHHVMPPGDSRTELVTRVRQTHKSRRPLPNAHNYPQRPAMFNAPLPYGAFSTRQVSAVHSNGNTLSPNNCCA